MKKTLVIAALTMVSASAFASQTFTMRADYENLGKYTNISNADAGATSMFNAKLAVWDIASTVGDAKVNARVDFLTPGSAAVAGTTTSLANFVGWGYISKPMGDWTFSVGKLLTNQGGFEVAKIVAGDTYFNSLASTGAGTTTSNTANPASSNGVGVDYKMGMHKLGLQVTNMTNYGSGTSTYKKQNQVLNYEADFSSDLAFSLEYGAGYNDVTTGPTNIGLTHTLLGLNYGMGDGWNLQFDYTMNSAMTDATGAKADKLTSMVAEVRKTGEMYTPVLKVESSTYNAQDNSSTWAGSATAAGNSSFARTAMALALEVKPVAKDSFRYHVAYISTSDKYGAAVGNGTTGPLNATVTQATLVAGIKFSTDMLGK